MEKAVNGSTHEYFQKGKCLRCHDVHGSNFTGMIITKQGFLCHSCHGTDPADKIENIKSSHSPVVNGECTKCHSPHKANLDSLLLAGYPDVCLNCHTDLKAKMYKEEKELQTVRGDVSGEDSEKSVGAETPVIYVHALSDLEKCQTCHKPHFSEELALIVKPIQPLCGKCHDYKESSFNNAHLNISANMMDCRNCHAPHISQHPKFFKDEVHKPFAEKACKDCHIVERQ
jgi:predicted CXXCH cytochrome family protein